MNNPLEKYEAAKTALAEGEKMHNLYTIGFYTTLIVLVVVGIGYGIYLYRYYKGNR
jgi:hypothetical protein